MNQLSICNNTSIRFLYKKEFKKIVDEFSKLLNYSLPINVDVLITNNNEIKKISKQYRNINKETDVLSFPFAFENSSQIGIIFLGEIVLSYEKIKKQAKEFNHSIKREVCYLFAHGLVHLSGKDHKNSKLEEQEFNSLVYNIMEKVNIKRE